MYYNPTIFVKSYGALTYFDDLMVITGYRNRNGKQKVFTFVLHPYIVVPPPFLQSDQIIFLALNR